MAKTILVVEDNEGTLGGLAQALESSGYDPSTVTLSDDPEAQFDFLNPEMIFISLRVPGAVQLCERIREKPEGAIVPIIFVGTGGEDVTSPSDALAQGGDFYFRHPLEMDRVLAKVATYIGPGTPSTETPPTDEDPAPLSEEVTDPAVRLPDVFGSGDETAAAGPPPARQDDVDTIVGPIPEAPVAADLLPDFGDMPTDATSPSPLAGASDALLDEIKREEERHREGHVHLDAPTAPQPLVGPGATEPEPEPEPESEQKPEPEPEQHSEPEPDDDDDEQWGMAAAERELAELEAEAAAEREIAEIAAAAAQSPPAPEPLDPDATVPAGHAAPATSPPSTAEESSPIDEAEGALEATAASVGVDDEQTRTRMEAEIRAQLERELKDRLTREREAERAALQLEREEEERRAEQARQRAEQEVRRAEEEAQRIQDDARREAQEARRQAEETKREAQRVADEARERAEEQTRLAEQARELAQEQARQIAEETKREAEQEARRLAEEARRQVLEQAEHEARRMAEEARENAEREAQRLAEEARQRAEQEARRVTEEARQRAQEEAQRVAEEARAMAEEETLRAAQEARAKAEQEARDAAELARLEAEEQLERATAEARQRLQEEAKEAAEETRRELEEQTRREIEAAREQAAQQVRLATEQARIEAEQRAEQAAEEARLAADQAREEIEAEARRAADDAIARAEERAQRAVEEAQRKADERAEQAVEAARREADEQTARALEQAQRAADRAADEARREAAAEAEIAALAQQQAASSAEVVEEATAETPLPQLPADVDLDDTLPLDEGRQMPARTALPEAPVEHEMLARPTDGLPRLPQRAASESPAPLQAPEPEEGAFTVRHDIGAVLNDFWRQQVTGRVDFTVEQKQRTVFFERGSPVDGYSNDVYDRMEEYLYREGKITRAQYQAVRVKRLHGPRRIGAYLVNEKFLKPHELFSCVRGHLEEIVFGLFEWTDGWYRYLPEPVDEPDRVALDVDPRALVVEGIRRKYLMPRLMELVGAPSSLLGVRDDVTVDMEALGLAPVERRVVRLLDGSRSVEDLVFSTGLNAHRVYCVLAALLSLGLAEVLVRGIEGIERDGSSQDDAIDAERIREKLEQVRRLDYFQVLGIGRTATPYEIDRAYQRNVQEFDSGRFSESVRRDFDDSLREIERVLQDAREVLRNDALRDAYARHLP